MRASLNLFNMNYGLRESENFYLMVEFYRAAKVLEIYEGTKEVEKIIISREVLGKL